MIQKIFTTILAALVTISVIAGDVTIKSKNLDGQKNAAGTTNFYFKADQLLIENQFKNDNSSLIFNSAKKEFAFIDHKKKEYYQVTEGELKQFIGQLRQMLPMMKAFLGNMPPEQQAKLKKQFGALLGEEQPKTTFKKVGSKVKVKSWSADRYDAQQGDSKIAEMYLTSYSDLGVSKQDFKSFDAMRRVFGEIIGEFAGVLPLGPSIQGLASNLDENPAFNTGVPVRSLTYKDGSLSGENVVDSISKNAIGANKFNIPSGYARKKLQMPEMR